MSSALQNVCFFISTRNGQNGSMTLFYLIASSCFLLSCCVLSYTMPTQQLGSRGFFKRMSSDHFRDATLAGKTDTLEASSFSALASMGSYLLASCLSGHLPLGILPPGVCLLIGRRSLGRNLLGRSRPCRNLLGRSRLGRSSLGRQRQAGQRLGWRRCLLNSFRQMTGFLPPGLLPLWAPTSWHLASLGSCLLASCLLGSASLGSQVFGSQLAGSQLSGSQLAES